MEPRLVQGQTQKLILSPQIRQYLKLLQLPIAELRTAIEQELAENPALEEVAKDRLEEPGGPQATDDSPKSERDTEELRFDEAGSSLLKLTEGLAEEGFYSQDDLSLPDVQDQRARRDYKESLVTRKESLSDYLLSQVGFLDLAESETQIAEEIIGNLNDDGYLAVPCEEIAAACHATLTDVESILKIVQRFDPPGIAARDLRECLLLQLEKRGDEARLALDIVGDHFPLLQKKQWDLIAKRIKAESEALENAKRLIAHLDPRPGRSYAAEEAAPVTPDASVSFDDSEEPKLVVEIYDETLPELRISPYYRRLLKQSKLDPEGRRFLKAKLQSALDFLKALVQRRSTLRNITEEIVRSQHDFFEKGFSHLKPLRLKDIGDQLGIHESTVSRAIQGKYLSTPLGTLPYKSFFSARMETEEGGVESQKSLMEKVRGLILSEDPRNPLSDQEIASRLQKEGIRLARRTVAKYRELLKILPTHLRRQR
jgi:RNA polymerase sigma-54 factor